MNGVSKERCRASIGSLVCGLFILMANAGGTSAQTSKFPTGPIRMIVPFAAGGPTDLIARSLAQRVGDTLGVSIVSENVTGGGGSVGVLRAASSPPDGYTILLGNQGTHALVASLFKNPPYDPVTDFQPVALVARSASVVLGRNGIPGDGLNAFIAYARAQPNPVTFGSGGLGSSGHLTCTMLAKVAGFNAVHVPYRGSAPVLTDVLGERIDFTCDLAVTAKPYVEAKQLKGLVVAAESRSPLLPQVPTSAELGLPNFRGGAWHAVFLPKGTPLEIVDRINKAIQTALDDPAFIRMAEELGVTFPAPGQRTPDGLTNFLKDEVARWRPIVESAGIVPQ